MVDSGLDGILPVCRYGTKVRSTGVDVESHWHRVCGNGLLVCHHLVHYSRYILIDAHQVDHCG